MVNTLPFDMMMVRQTFIDSMRLDEDMEMLNISVRDLIAVYNSLIEKKALIIIPNHEEEDPISILLTALGDRTIDIKKNER